MTSSLKTSNYAGAMIAHETDTQNYPCRAAVVQTLDLNGDNPQPFVTLTFNNVAGLQAKIARNLQYVRHDTQHDGRTFDVHLSGADSIVVGLPALFRMTQNRWEDYVVSRPVISEEMQDQLLDACSDFLKRRADMPSPDEF